VSSITGKRPALLTAYEEEFVHQMDDIEDLIERTENPLHRKILINYRRHGMLEVSGRYDDLLKPDMTTAHPHYRIFEGGEATILDGMDAVRSFYQTLEEIDMLVMWTGRQKMAVGDFGFAGEAEFSQFVPGKMLSGNVFSDLDSSSPKDSSTYNPEGWYLVRRTLAFVWHYTLDGLLIGENVYEDVASKTVEEVDAADVITGKRAAELLAPLIDKYELPVLS
jgi:hypothetical protein